MPENHNQLFSHFSRPPLPRVQRAHGFFLTTRRNPKQRPKKPDAVNVPAF
jgi:hypothetical protein